MVDFNTYFFDLLPHYFKSNDNYKDINNKGLLERYLGIFGVEIKDEIIPKLENYLINVDPYQCDEKFLNDISYTLGNPPDIFGNPTLYRKLLSTIISVYKIKGTIRSYKLFFSLLGFEIDIIEYPNKDLYYDDFNLYDTDILYDTICQPCSFYSIVFWSKEDDCSIPLINPIDKPTLDKLKAIIFFNEPINAKLKDLIQNAKVCESVNACIQEKITLTVIRYNSYDDGLFFDNSQIYDKSTILSFQEIFNNCPPPPEQEPPLPEGVDYWYLEDDFIIQ